MMNSSASDDLESVRRIAAIYDIDFPILLDESQLVAETLQITHAGEVLVLDPRSRRLLYRGPLTAASGTDGPRGVLKFDSSLERCSWPPRPKGKLTRRQPWRSTPLPRTRAQVQEADAVQPTFPITRQRSRPC